MSTRSMNTHCITCRMCATVILLRGGSAAAHITCTTTGEHRTHLMPGARLDCHNTRAGAESIDTEMPPADPGNIDSPR